MIFPFIPVPSSKINIQQFNLKNIINKQSMLLHGEERRFIKFMPKVLHKCINLLKKNTESLNSSSTLTIKDVMIQLQLSVQNKEAYNYPALITQVEGIRDSINLGNWDPIEKITDQLVFVISYFIDVNNRVVR